MDPIILPIIILAAIGLATGRKKKGGKKDKDLAPGPKRKRPTPRLPGTPDPGTDPLPEGAKGGHLPKGEGYDDIIPDMTTEDLWVSPDCQAYLIGSDWYPLAEDPDEGGVLIDAYQWFVSRPGMSYDPEAYDAIDDRSIEGGYEASLFPEYSALDEFALAVLMEAAPECARTMPLFGDYDSFDDWEADYDAWAESYPVLDRLFAIIKNEAATGTAYEDINVYEACDVAPEEYVGARNMKNAWEDKEPAGAAGCIEFGETG